MSDNEQDDSPPKDGLATAYMKGYVGGLSGIMSSNNTLPAVMGALDGDRDRAKLLEHSSTPESNVGGRDVSAVEVICSIIVAIVLGIFFFEFINSPSDKEIELRNRQLKAYNIEEFQKGDIVTVFPDTHGSFDILGSDKKNSRSLVAGELFILRNKTRSFALGAFDTNGVYGEISKDYIFKSPPGTVFPVTVNLDKDVLPEELKYDCGDTVEVTIPGKFQYCGPDNKAHERQLKVGEMLSVEAAGKIMGGYDSEGTFGLYLAKGLALVRPDPAKPLTPVKKGNVYHCKLAVM
jgi:hypothetical protein